MCASSQRVVVERAVWDEILMVQTNIMSATLRPLPKFSGRVGTLGIYSIVTTDQQHFCVDTIKYYSIHFLFAVGVLP